MSTEARTFRQLLTLVEPNPQLKLDEKGPLTDEILGLLKKALFENQNRQNIPEGWEPFFENPDRFYFLFEKDTPLSSLEDCLNVDRTVLTTVNLFETKDDDEFKKLFCQLNRNARIPAYSLLFKQLAKNAHAISQENKKAVLSALEQLDLIQLTQLGFSLFPHLDEEWLKKQVPQRLKSPSIFLTWQNCIPFLDVLNAYFAHIDSPCLQAKANPVIQQLKEILYLKFSDQMTKIKNGHNNAASAHLIPTLILNGLTEFERQWATNKAEQEDAFLWRTRLYMALVPLTVGTIMVSWYCLELAAAAVMVKIPIILVAAVIALAIMRVIHDNRESVDRSLCPVRHNRLEQARSDIQYEINAFKKEAENINNYTEMRDFHRP